MDISKLLDHHARYRPDRTALDCGGRRYHFGEFDRLTNQLANALLGAGFRPGQQLTTVMGNCVELLLCYWACAKTGLVVVPASPLLQGPALLNQLRDSESAGVVADADFAETLRQILPEAPAIAPDRVILRGPASPPFNAFGDLIAGQSTDSPQCARPRAGDAFNIIYSSGTTGQPKGIIHTHQVRAMYATLFANAWRMTPESVVLHTGSIVFNGAFVTLMPAIYSGATYVLHEVFEPARVLRTIREQRVTHIMLVPSQIVALMQHSDFDASALDSLQMILSLGAPLHLEHKQRLAALLPNRFHELYGLTEGFVTILDRTDFERKPNSVGIPPPFFSMRIVDGDGRDLPPGEIGEICGLGPILMPGYYKRPQQTEAAIRDGWLHTGDLGYVDEDGYLYLVDRQKDLIISGGINVYPRDIEEVAVQHPAISEVAVFGIPDPRWGETPIAAVTLRADRQVDGDELAAWINARLDARYQRIKQLVILDDFPRNLAGKTLKRVIRERYLQQEAPQT